MEEFLDAVSHALPHRFDHIRGNALHIAAVLFAANTPPGEEIAATQMCVHTGGMQYDHLALLLMHGAADQWDAEVGADTVQQLLRVQVIGTIGYEMNAPYEVTCIGGIEEAIVSEDLNRRHCGCEPITRSGGFRLTDIASRVQCLPLQVPRFNTITVYQP